MSSPTPDPSQNPEQNAQDWNFQMPGRLTNEKLQDALDAGDPEQFAEAVQALIRTELDGGMTEGAEWQTLIEVSHKPGLVFFTVGSQQIAMTPDGAEKVANDLQASVERARAADDADTPEPDTR